MANVDMKALLDRHTSGAEVVRQSDLAERAEKGNFTLDADGDLVPREVSSWDEFFNNVFGNPLQHPKHTQILVRRYLPVNHVLNPTSYDLYIPFMFTMTDKNGFRWWGYLYDSTLDRGGWQFLLMLPNPHTLLEYLSGQCDLMKLYHSAGNQMFMVQPDVRNDLIQTNMDHLPETALPAEDSIYDENIWFDENDIFFGHNDVNTFAINDLAKNGQFYQGDTNHWNDPMPLIDKNGNLVAEKEQVNDDQPVTDSHNYEESQFENFDQY